MTYKDQYYIEIEDGWYSIFGTETGKCYAQFGCKQHAEKWMKEHTTI